jgi:hypothetical protein
MGRILAFPPTQNIYRLSLTVFYRESSVVVLTLQRYMGQEAFGQVRQEDVFGVKEFEASLMVGAFGS